MLKRITALFTSLFAALAMLFPISISAHCDAIDGPVIIDAKKALNNGRIDPVLKWLKPEYVKEINTLFAKTLEVRKMGEAAKEMAEAHFFESLVRLHRAGEGASFTGIKPAGQTSRIVQLTDKTIKENNIEDLITKINSHAAKEIRKRFENVMKAKKDAETSPQKGREYVKAYVKYTHFMENLHASINASGTHDHKE